MKKLNIIFYLSALILFTQCNTGLTGSADEANDESMEAVDNTAAILNGAEELQQRFVKALNSADFAGIMACYWSDPNVVLYPIAGANVHVGYDAVKVEMAAFVENAGGAKLELIDNKFMVSGEHVIAHGLWKMTGTMPDGQPYESTGRYLDIAKEINGTWQYILDYPSVPMQVGE